MLKCISSENSTAGAELSFSVFPPLFLRKKTVLFTFGHAGSSWLFAAAVSWAAPVATSPVGEPGLQAAAGLGWVALCRWDLPDCGEHASPVLAGRFSTTEPQGSPLSLSGTVQVIFSYTLCTEVFMCIYIKKHHSQTNSALSACCL